MVRVGYVYLLTNLITGKMYVGSHDGSNKRYFASGIAVRAALQKYGKDSFLREVLYLGPDFRVEEEKILLRVDAASSPLYYNLKNTATGWGTGKSNPNFGKFGSEHPMGGRAKSSKNLQVLRDRKGPAHHMYGKPGNRLGAMHSAESRKLIGEKNRGRPVSSETREKLRRANLGKKYPKRTCPHCGLVGAGSPMSRFHFSNCKKRED